MTAAYEAYTFEGYGFYYYKDSYNDSTACHARDGIWRVDLATGEEQQIFGDNSGRYLISRCDLSYHGKQLIFHGASIGNGIVNNDGTGYEKLPAELPLTTNLENIHWTRMGIFTTAKGKLRRYDVHTGEYEVVPFPTVPGWDDGTFKGGGNKMCLASGDGTRLWNRTNFKTVSFGPKRYSYPKVEGHTISYTYFVLNDDGSPARMFGRNFWGHGDVITLDGEHIYSQDFGHQGWNVLRHSDGQQIADQRREYLPVPEPDFKTECGGIQDAERPMIHCTNDNDWLYFLTIPFFQGVPDEDINHDCFLNTVWNRHSNTHVKVHGPEDGTWMPRCRSTKAVQCAGFWKGYDLPDPEENSAYLVAYQKDVTLHCAQQTSTLEKTVRIGTIDDTPLDNVAFSVDPPSAESWLNPSLEHTKVTITMNVRVDPTALPDGEKHDATITVQASSARNTAAVSVHVDRTMLPQPTDFVVYHTNMTDSFAYPELSWSDRADGEDGYIIEIVQPKSNDTWQPLDTCDANAARFISELYTYSERTRWLKYRVFAFSHSGFVSPRSEEGYFCVPNPEDSILPLDQAWVHEEWVAETTPAIRGDTVEKGSSRGVPPPLVTMSRGSVTVQIQSKTLRGRIQVVQPDGRMVVNRSIDAGKRKSVTMTLPNSAAGVYLIRVIGVRHGSGSVLKCVALHR